MFLTQALSYGLTAAVVLGILPVLGSAAIVLGAVVGSRMLAALLPTP